MGTIWIEANDQRWVASPAKGCHSCGVELICYGSGAERGTALLTPPETTVHVNGQRVWSGLRILHHKDEIQVGDRRLFYSAEMQPCVGTYEARADAAPKCAVCRMPIGDGESVVACPGCSRLYHQSDAKPCWTYRERCAFCSHPTSLTGEAAWQPEQEETNG
jgi:hypothetical protein